MDDLIRNSSGHEEYSIQDGDWEQLQMMMNADNRRKKMGWLWKDIIVLVITVVCFAFVNNDSPINNGMKRMVSLTANEITRITELEEKADTDLSTSYQDASIDNTKWNTERQITAEEQAFANVNKNKRTEGIGQLIEESKGGLVNANKNVSIIETEDNNQLKSTAGTEGNISLAEESNLNSINSEEEVSEQGITGTLHPNTVTLDSISTKTESELSIEKANIQPLTVESLDSNTVTEKASSRKMHVYFGIGTEWSVASKMPIGPTKLKLQLGGEYQFFKKWSLLSGVNYTVKDYQTNAEDYTVKPGFWTNGIKPSRISAKCNVLEIPLNIRYYFNAQDSSRNSFFLTAGASTYFMASERYNFTYDVGDPSLKQGWNGKWENIHYFSALHFSAGYQKSLQRNCSVLVEPYVDLPLNGIGFGQIDLISFGLSLQFKY